jgi:type IV pilus assembly protein PilA
MNYRRHLKGFTLIELIVVIGILAILATIVVIAVNPSRQFAQSRNAKRNNDVLAILDAVHQYAADAVNNGSFPAGIPSVASCSTANASGDPPTGTTDVGTGGANLTSTLVSNYLTSVPTDPSSGTASVTGYKICKDSSTNAITVWADNTEIKSPTTASDIKVTR